MSLVRDEGLAILVDSQNRPMEPPSPEELDEIERLAKAATPGPWRPEREPPPVGNAWFDELPTGAVPIESRGTAFALGVAVAGAARRADAEHIAALAPNTVLRLIAMARREPVVCDLCAGDRFIHADDLCVCSAHAEPVSPCDECPDCHGNGAVWKEGA